MKETGNLTCEGPSFNIGQINEMKFCVDREKNGIFRRVWQLLRFIFVGEAIFKI